MSREKTAAFLVGCLSRMAEQTAETKNIKRHLARLAHGAELQIVDVLTAYLSAIKAANRPADWAAVSAAAWATNCQDKGETGAAAHWSALTHADPAVERNRQATMRQKLGLNTKQEA